MLLSRFLLYFFVILLILNDYCQCQHEIRKAIKAKKNRKLNEGKQSVQYVQDKTRGAINRADAKINRKHQNAKRKMHAIKDVINS